MKVPEHVLDFLRLLMLWRNPIFIRYYRSKLRWKGLLGWASVTLLFSAFIFFIIYYSSLRTSSVTSQEAALATIPALLIVQCLIMMCKGSFSIAAGITREGIEGVLDYQRLSPMSPLNKMIGYLFGLPVLDYVLFLLTLPFMIFAILKAELPGAIVLRVYSVFFTSVLVYHMTAFMAGMVVKRRFLVGFLTQVLMFVLYLILPALSELGYVFFEHLTIRPTFFAEFQNEFNAWDFDFADPSIAFFQLEIPCHLFSLAIQILFFIVFSTIVYRKWRNENSLLLDKHSAVIAVGVLFLGLIGTMLPQIDSGRIFPSWGPRYLLQLPPVDFVKPSEALLILGMFGTLSLIISVLTLTMITPSRDVQIKGLRRMVKLHLKRVPWSEDASSSIWHAMAVCLIIFIGWWLFVEALFASRWYQGYELSPYAWIGAFLSVTIPAICFQMFLEAKGRHWLFMVLLGVWLVPLLGGSLLAVASDKYANAATYIIALSGFVLPFYSMEAGLAQSHFLTEAPQVRPAFLIVLALYTTAVPILIVEWRKHRKELKELVKQ
ncbi:MAG: hypothetical protein AAFY98_05205 [Verrucomicrobiota bacterium]